MTLTIGQSPSFASKWKRLGLTDTDLRDHERALLSNLSAGAVVAGTGGVRKIRFAPALGGRGKSGAYRVCYGHFPVYSRMFLFILFAKNEQANLTASQKTIAAGLVKEMAATLGRF